MEVDVFISLPLYPDIVSLLLPAAEIMELTVVFKTSFQLKSFTSISSQPPSIFPCNYGLPSLVQDTAKNLLLWGHPIMMELPVSIWESYFFSQITSWVSFSCLYDCLPSQLTAPVLLQREGAVKHFRGKQLGSWTLFCTQTVLTNGVQQHSHQP